MPNKAENPWGLTVEDVSNNSELEQLLTLQPDFSEVPLGEVVAYAGSIGLSELALDTDVPVAQFQSSM